MNKGIIAFDLVHEIHITKLIERLPNKKGSGLDNISNILIKRLCSSNFSLIVIYNKLLMVATFQDMCKIAKVILVCKGGEYVNDNYRPISFLSLLLRKL